MSETWLVEAAQRSLTPNRYHEGYKPELIKAPEAVVVHYTATRSMPKTLRWLTMSEAEITKGIEAIAVRTGKPQPKAAPASAHFLIDRDGSVRQLAPLEARTWHAGGATSKLFEHGNVNGRTIGIELMNVGPLKAKTDDKGLPGFVAVSDGRPWEISGVEALDGTFWEPFPPHQLDALVDALQEIYKHFPTLHESKRLVGHCDVDPTRKVDPGPAFPWATIRERLFGH